MREELGFHVYLKLSIYAGEVTSTKHANQCKACKLIIHYVRRPEPRTFNMMWRRGQCVEPRRDGRGLWLGRRLRAAVWKSGRRGEQRTINVNVFSPPRVYACKIRVAFPYVENPRYQFKKSSPANTISPIMPMTSYTVGRREEKRATGGSGRGLMKSIL